MTRRKRAVLLAGSGVPALAAVAVLAGFLTVRSEWFREKVRQRIVFEVERATGGRVELENYAFDPVRLTARVGGFTLRGKERPDEPPLFHADRVEAGIRVISVLRRDIDLVFLAVRSPRIHIIVYPDNSTNFPSPAHRRGRTDAIGFLLKLAVGRFAVENGVLQFAARRIPIETRGENLQAKFTFDHTGPRYLGDVRVERLRLDTPGIRPAVFDAAWKVMVERGRIAVAEARFSLGRSWITASGAFENFSDLRARFDVDARLYLDEVARSVNLPVERRGVAAVRGEAVFGGNPAYSFRGTLNGYGLAAAGSGVSVRGARVNAGLELDPRGVRLDKVAVSAAGGVFQGRARIDDWNRFSLAGEVFEYSLDELAAVAENMPPAVWSGSVSGRLAVQGRIDGAGAGGLEVDAALDVTPGDGPRPIEGSVELAYRQQQGTLEFGASRLATSSTAIEFRGVLGHRLDVRLDTRDLSDLLPGIALAGGNPPRTLPVSLRRGKAVFEGRITGPLDSPRMQGSARLERFVFEGREFDALSADFAVDKNALAVHALKIDHQGLAAQARGGIGLVNWRPADSSVLRASASIRKAPVARLFAGGSPALPFDGLLSASVEAAGTLGNPTASARFTVEKFSAYGEEFDRLRARVSYGNGKAELAGGVLDIGKASVRLAGSYTHPPRDWRKGTLRFEAAGERLPLQRLAQRIESLGDLSGTASFKAAGALWIQERDWRLARLDADAGLENLSLENRPAGSVSLNAATAGGRLTVTAAGSLLGAGVRGSGEWELAGRHTGQAKLAFEPVRFADLQALLRPGKPLPFAGFAAGSASLAVPLAAPREMQGEVRLENLQLWPMAGNNGRPGAVRRELVLENSGPVVLAVDAKGIQVRQARFVAAQTELGVDGVFSLQSKTPWNLRLKGGVNFALLRVFYPKLVTGGKAALNASVRGVLAAPQISGRMELQDASLFLEDYPIGVSNAKGLVLFDRDRATIEKMTAEIGGGELTLSGFVGFGGEAAVFRLQAEAERARIRYPEGVSATADASLSLSGTAQRSLITGTITVGRAAFMPRTDLGSLLLASAKPLGAPTAPNPVLSSMQLDVRVDSAPNLQFQTALARDLQTELDLRLRGTLAKPVVLGEVLVTQGEIQFFGNKYRINRGEIGLFNPARIEPVLDLDLETRVRGISVTINFSGSINKLNMTYRSDPPLQPEEIVALLAVGRAPLSGLAASQTIAGQNTSFQTGANTLLGQALAAPLTSRLQRFFGVSRLKIDPQLTGVDTTPQARLTIEQQISRDITLTYVTNLSETKQQIVRLEWDVSRQWSVVAIRDENGVFAIDFLYKKRF